MLGLQHRAVLIVFVAGCISLLLLGARLRSRPSLQQRVMWSEGIAIVALCAPFELRDVVIGLHHPRTGLPLQICDVGWLVAATALLTRGRRSTALLYFWGLTLCVQGVVTPDTHAVFPQLQFFGFWLRHIVPVWAAVQLVGSRIGPSWRGYRFTIFVTTVWAALAISLNALIGSNYGYLNGKPHVHSLLDVLGPWPWYVLVEAVLVVGVWALMTWPWNRMQVPARD